MSLDHSHPAASTAPEWSLDDRLLRLYVPIIVP
jgi:hypothetical protein